MSTASIHPGFGGARDFAGLIDKLRTGRRRLTLVGVLLMIAGVVAIVVPAVASVATAIFIGWILVAASVFMAVDAMAVRERGWMAIRLLLALLTLAAGVYLLVAPLDGVFTLTVMLVLWFVAIGMARLVAGFAELGVPGAGMNILAGVLSLALGILIALELPSSADWAIGLIVGVEFMFSGAMLLALSREVHHLEQAGVKPPRQPQPPRAPASPTGDKPILGG